MSLLQLIKRVTPSQRNEHGIEPCHGVACSARLESVSSLSEDPIFLLLFSANRKVLTLVRRLFAESDLILARISFSLNLKNLFFSITRVGVKEWQTGGFCLIRHTFHFPTSFGGGKDVSSANHLAQLQSASLYRYLKTRIKPTTKANRKKALFSMGGEVYKHVYVAINK